MNKKIIIKIFIDAIMFVLFMLLMSEFLIKEAHLWLGIASGVLFLLHNALNWRWYKNLFKGKYTVMRIVHTIVNFLLWIMLICCIVSGILILPNIFIWYENGVKLHLVSSAWVVILMAVHLGLHWSMFVGMTKKMAFPNNVKVGLKWACRIAVLALCVYGGYIFIDRRFWEEMFLIIDYQKEYNYSKTAFLYLVESIALSSVFVSLTYYIKKFALQYKNKRRCKLK